MIIFNGRKTLYADYNKNGLKSIWKTFAKKEENLCPLLSITVMGLKESFYEN